MRRLALLPLTRQGRDEPDHRCTTISCPRWCIRALGGQQHLEPALDAGCSWRHPPPARRGTAREAFEIAGEILAGVLRSATILGLGPRLGFSAPSRGSSSAKLTFIRSSKRFWCTCVWNSATIAMCASVCPIVRDVSDTLSDSLLSGISSAILIVLPRTVRKIAASSRPTECDAVLLRR